MSHLIESIKLLDGRFYNLYYHEQRMIRSLNEVFRVRWNGNLEKILSDENVPKKGLFKCRLGYGADKSFVAEFIPYHPKPIRSLKIVTADDIDYGYKFSNRTRIDQLFSLRRVSDDILIVKHGKVTDTSFANIVFRRRDVWCTPSTPLLEGTMRQRLLEEKRIRTEEIRLQEIRLFQGFRLINAMMEFEGPEIDVSNIVV